MTAFLHYKDYQGSACFERDRLIIRVLHIDDSISSECDRASEAQTAFEELIDDYLETCSIVGKEPSKSFKGSFNVRVDPVLHKRAAMAATLADVTLNAWVSDALKHRLDQVDGRYQLSAENMSLYINAMNMSSSIQASSYSGEAGVPDVLQVDYALATIEFARSKTFPSVVRHPARSPRSKH